MKRRDRESKKNGGDKRKENLKKIKKERKKKKKYNLKINKTEMRKKEEGGKSQGDTSERVN